MNKSERINDLLFYLNDKNYFNLKDLMEKYNISKSTALRDINSLEDMGMPIFAEYGRNGRYGILKNRLLSPIIFTLDEMYALYFSMLSLRNYQSTPFHLDLSKLKSKFESCMSEENAKKINRMEEVFKFNSFKQVNESVYLKEILYSAINDLVTDITYFKDGGDFEYRVQFFDVSSSFGQWYTSGYDHISQQTKVFRCDKIRSLKVNQEIKSIDIGQIKKDLSIGKKRDKLEFKLQVTAKGKDIFLKENYPSMGLKEDGKRFFVVGSYDENELDFITKYIINYGEEVLSIEPVKLKKLVIEKLDKRIDYFKKL